MKEKGYVVFEDEARGYDLNLVGIRTSDMTANTFNDQLIVMYRAHGQWLLFRFPATTDPGAYYRLHPANVRGTAILKPGQYRGAYELGKHKGYAALRQKKPLTVYRDADRDDVLKTNEGSLETGMFGINIHRAGATATSRKVDRWSAGCQVVADPVHFRFLLELCKKSSEIYGNSFTYTLLTETDFA